MKKFLLSILIILILIFSAIYTLAFTPFGNGFVQNIIEDKLNESKKGDFKITEFELSFNNLKFALIVDGNSQIIVNGGFDIFKQNIDLNYKINIKDLSKFESVIGQKLNGSLNTQGIVNGDTKALVIKGNTDIASSQSEYFANLENFEPQKVVLSIKSLDINELLYILNQPNFVDAKLDLYAKLTDIDLENPKNLTGSIIQKIYDGVVYEKVLKDKFNINLPHITFEQLSNAKFEDGKIKQSITLKSNIASLSSFSLVDLLKESINSTYKLKINDLSKFEKTINYKLNGAFQTDGRVIGDKNLLNIDGKSDFSKSDTNYHITLNKNKPKDIKFFIKSADIEELLYILNQPIYAYGNIDIDGNIKNPEPKSLDGKIITKIYDGKINSLVAKKELKLKIKKLSFRGDINTNLDGNKVISKVNFLTSIANLYSQKVVFNIDDSSINADYLAEINDLNKLYFITKRKLKGSFKLKGDVLKDKNLMVRGVSETLGGNVKFKLINSDLNATINDIKVTKISDMLIYPRFFTSSLNADVLYNIDKSKGDINANLSGGKFLQNELTTLLKTFAKFDITREVYNDINLSSKINKNILTANLTMESKNTKIASNNTKLNLKNESIDSTLLVKIKDEDVKVNLGGKIKRPKITLDTKGLLKSKVLQKIEKNSDKIEKAVDKFIPEKLKNSQEFQNIKKGVEDIFLKQLDNLF